MTEINSNVTHRDCEIIDASFNGVSREEYINIAHRMQSDELARRIENDELLLLHMEQIVKWISIGMSEGGQKYLEYYKNKCQEVKTCKIIKELILMRKAL